MEFKNYRIDLFLSLFRNLLWDKSLKNMTIIWVSRGSVSLLTFYALMCGSDRMNGHLLIVMECPFLNDSLLTYFDSGIVTTWDLFFQWFSNSAGLWFPQRSFLTTKMPKAHMQKSLFASSWDKALISAVLSTSYLILRDLVWETLSSSDSSVDSCKIEMPLGDKILSYINVLDWSFVLFF